MTSSKRATLAIARYRKITFREVLTHYDDCLFQPTTQQHTRLMMLWIKALHIIFMVTWFAGLFYLPRLFVYHAQSVDNVSIARFKVMERKLYFGIMTPGAVLTVAFGAWLWLGYGFQGTWLTIKLILVAALIAYHLWCGVLVAAFKAERNQHTPIFYRWFNEFPVLILFGIVILVVVKPT